MHPLLSFSDIHDAKFRVELGKAESLRKQILRNYGVIGTVIFIGFALEAVTWMSIGIALVVVFVLAYSRRFGISKSEFLETFQSTTGRYLATAFDSNTKYDYNSYHKLRTLREACLVSGFPKQFGGKHMSTYQCEGIRCSISEIESHTSKKNVYGMQENQVVFNGLVGFAEIELPVNEPVLAMSDNMLSDNFLHVSNHLVEAIKKDTFTIYNAENAIFNLLIAPSVWLILIRYLEKSGVGIFMSLTKKGFCIAVESAGLLQADLLKSVYKSDEPQRYFEAYQLIFTILQMFCKRYQDSGYLIKS